MAGIPITINELFRHPAQWWQYIRRETPVSGATYRDRLESARLALSTSKAAYVYAVSPYGIVAGRPDYLAAIATQAEQIADYARADDLRLSTLVPIGLEIEYRETNPGERYGELDMEPQPPNPEDIPA